VLYRVRAGVERGPATTRSGAQPTAASLHAPRPGGIEVGANGSADPARTPARTR